MKPKILCGVFWEGQHFAAWYWGLLVPVYELKKFEFYGPGRAEKTKVYHRRSVSVVSVTIVLTHTYVAHGT